MVDMIDENCKGCNMRSLSQCYDSTNPLHQVTFHRMYRMAKVNGKEYVYSICPCGKCLIKTMCNEKCSELLKHERSPDSITIYSG